MSDLIINHSAKEQRIGIAADHGGFELKEYLLKSLTEAGYNVRDYGNTIYEPDDDYPDYILPLARALPTKEIDKAIAICGSGVGACVAANKVGGVRACLIHETFSAHQGVEDDNMNMICLGGRVLGTSLAWELVNTFISAKFIGAERHLRRLKKIEELETIKNTK